MPLCTTFWEILREAEAIIARAKQNPRNKDCEFFFRGEYHRFKPRCAQERHEGARARETASYHVLESNRNTRGGNVPSRVF